MAAPAPTPSTSHSNSPHSSHEVIETLSATTSETEDGLRKINQYLLRNEIGIGAFGIVHLGIDVLTKAEYAIKEFFKSRLRRKKQSDMLRLAGPGQRWKALRGKEGLNGLSTSNNPLDLVRGELAILKKLDHPNVIQLHEVLDDPRDDSLFMVFEMAHKGVLMDIKPNSTTTPYTEERSLAVFREMILGIEYLHTNGIVHRDIKPDNLLLSKDDVLKIVDFGVSEMFEKGNDKLSKSAGSPAFMPPELCKAHHGDVSGKAADIWSMGVTLYCLVYGRTPFMSDNIIDLMEKINDDPAEFDDTISPDLHHLLDRLLEKDPEKRITMAELREDPWVTRNGTDYLISKEENCQMVVTEITDEDLHNAIKSIGSLFTFAKAVTKFKRHSRHPSNSPSPLNNTTQEKKGTPERDSDSSGTNTTTTSTITTVDAS